MVNDGRTALDKAQSYGAKARKLQADNIEIAILEGLATAYEKPGRARDGLQLLRRGQRNASPDDWHYHEALAIVHQMARDPNFAKKEIASAIAVAPAFIRPSWNANRRDSGRTGSANRLGSAAAHAIGQVVCLSHQLVCDAFT